jgi:hypothetical protein
MTSYVIEPATFRLVPQCFYQLRYRVPPRNLVYYTNFNLIDQINTYTNTHIHIYIYIYIYGTLCSVAIAKLYVVIKGQTMRFHSYRIDCTIQCYDLI